MDNYLMNWICQLKYYNTNLIRYTLDNIYVNKLIIKEKQMILHNEAIKLMSKLNYKYNIKEAMSLDEYYYEYYDLFSNADKCEIEQLINEFTNVN